MTRRESAPSVAGGRQTAVLFTPRFSSGSIEFSSLAPSRVDRRGGTLYPAQFTRSSAARLPRASTEERADSRFCHGHNAVAVTRAADSEGGSDDAVGPRSWRQPIAPSHNTLGT